MTVKTVSTATLKINKLCGIFKGGPEFVVLGDGESLEVSFERESNQRCLTPMGEAIRVRVRSLDSLVARDPDHFFAATAPLPPRIPL
jgi:hypothetical protein